MGAIHGLTVGVNDAGGDPDGDKLTNYMEHQQPSDPHDPLRPGRRLLLGARVDPVGSQNREEALKGFERRIGRNVAVDRQFSVWDKPFTSHQLSQDLENNWIPFIGWKAETSSGEPVGWGEIARGAHDAWIRHQADLLRAHGGPVILNFHHEPENDVGASGSGSIADYREAWRRVVTIFRQEGATNVKFAFVLMAGSYRHDRADSFYPGDGYIDYIGSNFFNFAPGKPGAPWRSFRAGLSDFYNWGVARNKPLVIGSYGAQEDPDRPGRRASWLRRAANTLKTWPAVRVACYFESNRGYPWALDTSSALEAFRGMGSQLYFNRFELP